MRDLLASADFRLGIIVGVAGVLGIYLLLLLIGVVVKPWLLAKAAGANVPLLQLVGIRFRGSDLKLIIDAYVRAQKRGTPYHLHLIEATYLAFKPEVQRGTDLLAIVDREAGPVGSSGAV